MAVIEVDPIEAIIKLAAADADIAAQVGTRVEVWKRFGQDSGDWPIGSKALVLRPIGGDLHLTNHFSKPIIEARCYGGSPYECGAVWRALVAFTVEKDNNRTVAVTGGTALVYNVLPQAGSGCPALLWDEDTDGAGGHPYYQTILTAQVSHLFVN